MLQASVKEYNRMKAVETRVSDVENCNKRNLMPTFVHQNELAAVKVELVNLKGQSRRNNLELGEEKEGAEGYDTISFVDSLELPERTI